MTKLPDFTKLDLGPLPARVAAPVGQQWPTPEGISLKPFYVGAVGYIYNQISDDAGAPADFGGYRSRVMGVGPQAGWRLFVGKVAVDVNLRGYYEFAAQNRPQGANAWLTVSFSPAP